MQTYSKERYSAEGITDAEIKMILLHLKTLPASDLYETNKTIMRWLADGFILKREDRNQKDIYIEFINYSGLTAHKIAEDLDTIVAEPKTEDHTKNHIQYRFVNQLEITDTEKRIPDGIFYINNLPIVVFELKTAIKENGIIHDAYVPLSTRL